MNKALGPILIVTGFFLLDIVRINIPSFVVHEKHQHKFAGSGILGACFLGILFALSFCPISAALFFGSLIPLAASNKFGLSLPLIYGIGTGLPVLVFAFLIAMGVSSLNHWFHRVAKLEVYARKVTAMIFIAVGIYYLFAYFL